MYLVLTASKDTYITNKILKNSFRAEDANVGLAGTLDLFKLYDESTISGSDAPTELSRALIKFDFDYLQTLTSSILDLNGSDFKCELRMQDVVGGQGTPRDFTLIAFPLSQSFDEGAGRDVGGFSDLDVANFVTASYAGGTVYPWFTTGADAIGLLGSADIDIIGSGVLDVAEEQLGVTQRFVKGTEDLRMDITRIVSATMVGLLPDHGLRLSFSGTQETDDKTRFVKRFGSSNARNIYLRPTLHVSFDDTIHDNHSSFVFDVSGSIFLSNYHRSQLSPILSGTALTPLTGEDCLTVTIRSGSFSKSVLASTHTASTTGDGIEGLYSATFAIAYADSSTVIGSDTIYDFALKSGSLTFDEIWGTNDGTIAFLSSSLTLRSPTRSAYASVPRQPVVKITNLNGSYRMDDTPRLRLFGLDTLDAQNTPVKLPRQIRSVIFEELYFRVIDTDKGNVVIPFARTNNGTRCSTDTDGMFFDFDMRSLWPGRVYHFEFLLVDRGIETILQDKSPRFRVDAR